MTTEYSALISGMLEFAERSIMLTMKGNNILNNQGELNMQCFNEIKK